MVKVTFDRPDVSGGIAGFPWVEVLLDLPDRQGVYTYAIPPGMGIALGDVLTVPVRGQWRGGIAVGFPRVLPEGLREDQMRPVAGIAATGFFPPGYWPWLERIAAYYWVDLMAVVRLALPPGLLVRSQRRVCLTALPPGVVLSPLEQRLGAILGDGAKSYSVRYLRQKLGPAVEALIAQWQGRGWLRCSVLLDTGAKAKQQLAVILVQKGDPQDLPWSDRQRLQRLQELGGECWLSEFMDLARCSRSPLDRLARAGYLVITPRERLRLQGDPRGDRDRAKMLNPAQEEALRAIAQCPGYGLFLLHGVTGSGKTEVYMQAIAPVLARGQSALVLVPEIGLTPQVTARFRARFGDRVLVYHSALSDGERYDTWRTLLTPGPWIVIGTRSAVFVPLHPLGIIILDEEHDSSFHQSQPPPTYHARQLAQWRAEAIACPLVLGSATPALETWWQMRQKIGSYLSLPDRIAARPLPPVTVVDMRQELRRGNRQLFSATLTAAIQSQGTGEQAILFVARRGHSTFVACRSCGFVQECPHCAVALAYHYPQAGAQEWLRCHYCNHCQRPPRHCPTCQSPYFKFFGSGTQKVMEALAEHFPDRRCLRYDSDTTQRKGAHQEILEQFGAGEADILVGTQMLTKGIDLPNVTLVGVIAADPLLHRPDFRTTERAWQVLTQVAGRAGRGDRPGRVIIQTYNPDHPVLAAVRDHRGETMVRELLAEREMLLYPPCGRLLVLRFSGLKEEEVIATAQRVADFCGGQVPPAVEILGPAPAAITRIAQRYRWHLVLKWDSQSNPPNLPDRQVLRSLCPAGVRLAIDVDPWSID